MGSCQSLANNYLVLPKSMSCIPSGIMLICIPCLLHQFVYHISQLSNIQRRQIGPLKLSLTQVSRTSMSSSVLYRYQVCTWDTYIYSGKTPIQINNSLKHYFSLFQIYHDIEFLMVRSWDSWSHLIHSQETK